MNTDDGAWLILIMICHLSVEIEYNVYKQLKEEIDIRGPRLLLIKRSTPVLMWLRFGLFYMSHLVGVCLMNFKIFIFLFWSGYLHWGTYRVKFLWRKR